ncbi:MAG: hypothetical protein FWD40_08890 [Treponema sp.]|nr:hypothetical protein [Treponema sp.]
MHKKIIIIIIIPVLLLCAGIIALTLELDFMLPETGYNSQSDEEEPHDFSLESFSIPRWFISNAGGMILEEAQSRFVALRSEYALAIDSAQQDELPEILLPYFNDDFLIEVRMLYKNSEQIRTQWLFRDAKGNTRLNAVFLEIEKTEEEPEITAEAEESESDEEEQMQAVKEKELNIKGFIDILDENANFLSEYRFFEDGRVSKTDYEYKENLLISSAAMILENESDEDYIKTYTDNYRYNRSLTLRAIERIFYKDMQYETDDNILKITFPRRIMNAANDMDFISERLNLYPSFFGDIFIKNYFRMVFETDDRSRVLSQTLYDDEDEIIWIISNTWVNDRIASTVKKEGDSVLLAEFQYDSSGERILERNSRDGEVERIVRKEGDTEIEDLYMNNVVVLRAVWEDGKKVSETRMNY